MTRTMRRCPPGSFHSGLQKRPFQPHPGEIPMDFLFTDEQKAFHEQVLKFSQRELAPLAEEADWMGEFCWEAWRKMGGFGLLG
jgi:hypothetical protein